MSAAFVIDAALTMAWCFEDETTPAVEQLFDRLQAETTVVPGLWSLEVANSLYQAERRGRITPQRTTAFIAVLNAMDIETDGESASSAFDRLLTLARMHRLTVYDAAYLDLAVRRGVPVATLDVDLRAAASTLQVELLGL